jgi:hypothetical protein
MVSTPQFTPTKKCNDLAVAVYWKNRIQNVIVVASIWAGLEEGFRVMELLPSHRIWFAVMCFLLIIDESIWQEVSRSWWTSGLRVVMGVGYVPCQISVCSCQEVSLMYVPHTNAPRCSSIKLRWHAIVILRLLLICFYTKEHDDSCKLSAYICIYMGLYILCLFLCEAVEIKTWWNIRNLKKS